MADSQDKKQEPIYTVKGIPIHAYLIETGEFRWTPKSQARADRESAKRILEVLRKMPEDRRDVWASRLDTEQTKVTCPIIREEADLCNKFDEFCAAYNRTKSKPTKGGEQPNE